MKLRSAFAILAHGLAVWSCGDQGASTEVPNEIQVALNGRATIGEPLARVQVHLQDSAGREMASVVTDSQGYFQFQAVMLDTAKLYMLRVDSLEQRAFVKISQEAFVSVDPVSTALVDAFPMDAVSGRASDSALAHWFGTGYSHSTFSLAIGKSNVRDSLFTVRECFLSALQSYLGRTPAKTLAAVTKDGKTVFDAQAFQSALANRLRKSGVSNVLGSQVIFESTRSQSPEYWKALLDAAQP